MRHENARPAANGTGGEQVGQTEISVTRPDASVTLATSQRGGDPVVTRRRHARAVDEHLADAGYTITPADVLSLTIPPPLPDLAPCGGLHSGPCDRWSACTGLALSVVERDAAGAVHPWRVAA